MSVFQQKEGNGALFNQKKLSDKSPDMKGNILIGGNLYELSAWSKMGKNGSFLSLSAQVKGAYQSDKQPSTKQITNVQKNPFDDFKDDIPF